VNLIEFLFGENQLRSIGEVRQGNYNPSADPPRWLNWTNNDVNGIEVSREAVEGIADVYSCVRTLAWAIGCMPIGLYKKTSEGVVTDEANPLHKLLTLKPNKLMNVQTWLEVIIWQLCFRGNSYHKVVRSGGGKVVEIMPLDPDSIEIKVTKSGSLVYVYKNKFSFRSGEILHFKNLTSNGIYGETPINITKNLFATAIATEKYGTKSFARNANPTGILKVPGKLTPEQEERLRNDWDQLYGVNAEGSATAVLEQGTEFQPVSISASDAEFISTQKFNRSRVCGIFGVPPHLIADMEGAKYDNIESQGINFVKYTNLPFMKRIELTIKSEILSTDATKNHFIKLNADHLMRGDTTSRYTAYKNAIEAGFMTRNQARVLEDWNKLKGLDEPIQPLNMGTVGEKKKPEEKDEDRFAPILKDCIYRINTKVSKKLKSLDGNEKRDTLKAEFLTEKMMPFISEVLKPLAQTRNMEGVDFQDLVAGYLVQLENNEEITL